MTIKPKVTNRLVNEKSPYLLQHAHNPVDWYPWGDEAFEKAKAEDKPIFLSIGYSTCHWCHVMEKESFEDNEAAQILNKYFVSIKVDKEERPDIDSIYMTVCQMLTGSGGWPLTIIMTPDRNPFFAGTYFPKHSQYGHTGLIEILLKVNEEWIKNKNKLEKSAQDIVDYIKNNDDENIMAEQDTDILYQTENQDSEIIENTYENLKESFDPVFGGFGISPKFPTPHNLLFLLRYYKAYNNKAVLSIVEKTLYGMYKGGIFDHIGFGFSRYSVDKMWLVPHFEKMLYDNALLSMIYTEGYAASGNKLYKEIAGKIYEYILREMTSKEGGFYSAEDADSEGLEGKFYLWTYDIIIKVLGNDDGKLFCKYYGITEKGNFEGKNIPNLLKHDEKSDTKSIESQNNKIEDLRSKLFEYREKRIHPYKDDKILTSWNGLMIASLAKGGRILCEKKYINAAEASVSFILNKLIDRSGRLLARYRDDEAAKKGYLDDYAFLIWGLIELYEATFNSFYIEKALELNEKMLELFEDKDKNGLFLYGNDSENLILRPKEVYDGAIPSGNSVALLNLLRLFQITGNEKMLNKADGIINAFSNKVNQNPSMYTFFIMARLYREKGTKIEIIGNKNNNTVIEMLNEVSKRYLPFSEIIFINKDDENWVSAEVCENFSCRKPVSTIDEFKKMLDSEM